MKKLLIVIDMQNDFIDGSLGTSMELKRRLKVKGLLREENRTGKVVIQNSSGKQDMIDRSYELLRLPVEEKGTVPM